MDSSVGADLNAIDIEPGAGDSPFEIPEELLAAIKSELAPDERLLWIDQARRRGGEGRSGWITAIIWALGCGVVSAVCTALAIQPRSVGSLSETAAIVGLLSGIIGFFILVGMLTCWLSGLGERWAQRAVLYALTDRRAIIRRPQAGTRGVMVESIERGGVQSIHRVEYPDGSGGVFLQGAKPGAGVTTLDRVADVRRVEALAKRILMTSA